MTPRQKAKELVDKYYSLIPLHPTESDSSKECALIAVDEIIKSQPTLHIQYYQKVREEINKL